MRAFLKLALLPCLVFALLGCGEQTDIPADEAAALSASWRLDAAPDNALDVVAAKNEAVEGQTIALRGRIGGRMDPITPASGLFILMDKSLPSCADTGDGCPTPWDYCCDAPQTISAHAATVQLRDADGQPIALAADDLKPLDEVVVVGTVAPRPNAETLVLHATGVHAPGGDQGGDVRSH